MAVRKAPFVLRLVASLFLASFDNCTDHIEAYGLAKDALMWIVVRWLTATLLDHFASTGSCCEFIVNSSEDDKGDECEKDSKG